MTTRQKFWLKVALFVTFPVWFPVSLVAGFVAVPFYLIWMLVDDLVEPTPRYHGGKRAP